MLVGIAVVGAVGLLTAEASAKDKAHRVVAYIHNKSKKKWDFRSKPDLTLCVMDEDTKRKKCWPRSHKNNAVGPKTGRKVKKAVCQDQDYCYIGCRFMQRLYVSTTAATEVEVWDVDRRTKNDLMRKGRCYIRPNKTAKCFSSYPRRDVQVEFIPYDAGWCRRMKKISPGHVY
jgi:hypothetical protein